MEKDDFSNDSKNKNKSNHFILSEISIDDIVNHIASTTRQVLEVLDKNKNKAILNSDFNQNLIKDAMPI
jgi:mannosyltransferase OCH1-like enzyme